MRRFLLGLVALMVLATGSVEAQARRHKPKVPPQPPAVVATISVASQTLRLSVNGWPTASWTVSTAGVGYHTPRGTFRVQRMARVYFSKKYDNSPMPNSVFFLGGYAVHGTNHLKNLGRPVSHGCVRLAPENAARFFALAEEYGPSRVRVVVTD
jgi:lipoprotein-anchoring transpeptidase ErfK/SrfK